MKTNTFNICPTCIHKDTCVLTTQKSKVWSCSEYDARVADTKIELPPTKNKKSRAEMIMA